MDLNKFQSLEEFSKYVSEKSFEEKEDILTELVSLNKSLRLTYESFKGSVYITLLGNPCVDNPSYKDSINYKELLKKTCEQLIGLSNFIAGERGSIKLFSLKVKDIDYPDSVDLAIEQAYQNYKTDEYQYKMEQLYLSITNSPAIMLYKHYGVKLPDFDELYEALPSDISLLYGDKKDETNKTYHELYIHLIDLIDGAIKFADMH